MQLTGRIQRRLGTTLLISGVVVGTIGLLTPQVNAASVDPTPHEGNITSCPEGLEGLSTGSAPGDGEWEDSGVSFTNHDDNSIDFTSVDRVAIVYVKGGPGYNEYNYLPAGTFGDTGLVSPLNPGGNVPAVSHVVVCFGGTEPTTTTTGAEETTTTEVETTTTVAVVATTVVAPTTVVETEVEDTVLERTPSTVALGTPVSLVAEPEAETEVKAEVLARTGEASNSLVVAAGALLFLGGLAVTFAGPRREEIEA